MNTQKEIWKDVVGYENEYIVSNLGNVKILERLVKNKNGFRKIKERFLKQHTGTTGYKIVMLYRKSKGVTKSTHKLVAEAFLNHTPCGHKEVVDHLDNNPFNNNASNLQLITNRENSSKEKRGMSKYTGVYYHKKCKRWMSRILIGSKRKYLGSHKCETKAYIMYQAELLKLTN